MRLSFIWERKNLRAALLKPAFATAFASALWPGIAAFAQAEIQAPEVKVQDRRESAYGPVEGYRAARSATATKTDTLMLEIPQSIQVVPRDVIEDQNALNLIDVVQNVSNVRFLDSDNSDETLAIRGFELDTTPARDGIGFQIGGDDWLPGPGERRAGRGPQRSGVRSVWRRRPRRGGEHRFKTPAGPTLSRREIERRKFRFLPRRSGSLRSAQFSPGLPVQCGL